MIWLIVWSFFITNNAVAFYAGPPLNAGSYMALCDLTNDGVDDLVSVGSEDGLLWWRGQGNGSFILATPGGNSLHEHSYGPVSCGDFDGNGWVDVVSSRHTAARLWVHLNQEGGQFSVAQEIGRMPYLSDLVVGDFDHDCLPDIAAAGDAQLAVFHNNAVQRTGASFTKKYIANRLSWTQKLTVMSASDNRIVGLSVTTRAGQRYYAVRSAAPLEFAPSGCHPGGGSFVDFALLSKGNSSVLVIPSASDTEVHVYHAPGGWRPAQQPGGSNYHVVDSLNGEVSDVALAADGSFAAVISVPGDNQFDPPTSRSLIWVGAGSAELPTWSVVPDHIQETLPAFLSYSIRSVLVGDGMVILGIDGQTTVFIGDLNLVRKPRPELWRTCVPQGQPPPCPWGSLNCPCHADHTCFTDQLHCSLSSNRGGFARICARDTVDAGVTLSPNPSDDANNDDAVLDGSVSGVRRLRVIPGGLGLVSVAEQYSPMLLSNDPLVNSFTVHLFAANESGFRASTRYDLPHDSRVRDVQVADLDGDRDFDVVVLLLAGLEAHEEIRVYENHGNFSLTLLQTLTQGEFSGARDLLLVDLTGDGQLDCVTGSSFYGGVIFFEGIPPGGDGGSVLFRDSPHTVANSGNVDVDGLAAADVNNDTLIDVLVADSFADSVVALLNQGSGAMFSKFVLSNEINGARVVAAGDVNGDGFVDVLAASEFDDAVVWFENVGNEVEQWRAPVVITSDARGPISLSTGDIDRDGDLDVLVVGTDEQGAAQLLLNTGFAGQFCTFQPLLYSGDGQAYDAVFDDDHRRLFVAARAAGDILQFQVIPSKLESTCALGAVRVADTASFQADVTVDIQLPCGSFSTNAGGDTTAALIAPDGLSPPLGQAGDALAALLAGILSSLGFLAVVGVGGFVFLRRRRRMGRAAGLSPPPAVASSAMPPGNRQRHLSRGSARSRSTSQSRRTRTSSQSDAAVAGPNRRRNSSRRQSGTMVPVGVTRRNALDLAVGDKKQVFIDNQALIREQVLGEGAFGQVFKGKWMGVAVAIKQMKGASDRARDALMVEVEKFQAMGNHPNVVAFFGVCANPLAIVMEFCPGGSLEDVLFDSKRGPALTMVQLIRFASQISHGVQFLHASKVIHRDLAARNVLLAVGDVSKVTDFGLSRDDVDVGERRTQTTVGPVRHMAPEQMNHQIVSTASDIWALGVVVFEIFVRRRPWDGFSNYEVFETVMAGNHLDIGPLAPLIPPFVQKIMLDCWQPEPGDRPTAAVIATAFDHGELLPNAEEDSDGHDERYGAPPTNDVVANDGTAVPDEFQNPPPKGETGDEDDYQMPPQHTSDSAGTQQESDDVNDYQMPPTK